MKRGLLIISIAFTFILFTRFASAEACNLDVSLVNQDPYPASPGEYVKVVFQLNGVDNPQCGKVVFEFVESFPFSLDPGARNKYEITGGTYSTDYKSFLLAPYKVKVDNDALDGENEIKVEYYSNNGGKPLSYLKRFNITIQDSRTDFEVSIKDYDYKTNTLTLEILNSGEHDAEAVAVDIPKQDNIDVKGSNRYIVGSLDAKDDTSFSYEAIPKDGEIKFNVYYNDLINERRVLEKNVNFDSSFFKERKKDAIVPKSISYYVAIGEAILFVLTLLFNLVRKRRKKARQFSARRKD